MAVAVVAVVAVMAANQRSVAVDVDASMRYRAANE
jgi:hypothetical protein